MFCMLKKKEIYPAYASSHNSNHEEVILLMISKAEKQLWKGTFYYICRSWVYNIKDW